MSIINETYSLDDKIIGSSYLCFGIVCIVIYVPCLIVIYGDSELKALSCLRIMFHLGISDLVHVAGLSICGLLSLTGYAYSVPLWLSRLLMNFTVASWNSYMLLLNVLSLNRCVVFNCSDQWIDRLFGPKATKIWITICWFGGLCWLGFYLTPWGGFVYYPRLFTHYFDLNTPILKQEQLAVLINCFFNMSCIWVWCIFAVIGFKKQVGNIGGGSETLQNKERALLIQSVTICAVLFITDQYFHNIYSQFCPSTFLYCGVIGEYLMILNNSINPILYLTINKTIKKKVLTLIGMNNAVQPSTNVIQLY